MAASRTEYIPITWVNDETALNAANLNHIESGIEINNLLAKENANYIDEIKSAIIDQISFEWDTTNQVLSLIVGNNDDTDPYYTPVFHKTININLSGYYKSSEVDTELAKKVDKVSDYGLSKNDFTDSLKTKLDEIESGAEVNVQADWNEVNSNDDAFIKNKPTVETASNGGTTKSLVTTGEKYTWNNKQDAISSSNKLSSDLIDDTNKTNLFVTSSEKSTWSGKQNALSSSQLTATNSGIDSTKVGQITTNANNISTIQSLIPDQASTSNQLADKSYVDTSIATNASSFLGTYNIISDLNLTASATQSQVATAIASKLSSLNLIPSNNDYVFISYPDETVSTQMIKFDRYKYNATGTEWVYEYTLNNSSFTATQWATINSGATAEQIQSLSSLLAGNGTKTINSVSIIGTGNIDTKELFNVTYGTTTYTEILTAVANGKIPKLIFSDRIYYYQQSTSSQLWFSAQGYSSIALISINSSNLWATYTRNYEINTNKVTSLSSSSTDTQYPSAKAVYDYAQPIINLSYKLNADLVDDTNATNKFVTASDKTTWNNKSVVSVSSTGTSTDEVKYITINGTEKKIAGDTYETATTLEINRLFRTEYSITTSVTYGTYTGDTSLWTEETASVTITPSTDYSLPATITVTGATYTYDNSTGIISLSNVTGNVSITVVCEEQINKLLTSSNEVLIDADGYIIAVS